MLNVFQFNTVCDVVVVTVMVAPLLLTVPVPETTCPPVGSSTGAASSELEAAIAALNTMLRNKLRLLRRLQRLVLIILPSPLL
jgi:hypothetical protein